MQPRGRLQRLGPGCAVAMQAVSCNVHGSCGWPNFTPLTHVWVRARETQAAMEMLQCNAGIEAARNDLNRGPEAA